MAISTTLSGSSLYVPGAYSISQVQTPGGLALTTTGTLLLVGEAAGGAPGASAGYQTYAAAAFGSLLSNYISGPIVDAALAALTPSKTAGIGGYSEVIVWKTNASTQASLELENSTPAEVILLTDSNWGVGGNYKSVAVAEGSTSNQVVLTITDTLNNVQQVLPQNAAVPQLSIYYQGTGTACTLTISGASDSAKVLTTTCTGATPDNLNITLSNYTINSLIGALNANGKYVAVLLNTQSGTATPATDLDPLSAENILSGTSVLATTGDTTTSSNQLTSLASTDGIVVGQIITGTGIPNGTLVQAISGSTVTMSQEATATASTVSVSFSNVPELYRLQHEIVDVVNQNSNLLSAAVAGINPGVPAAMSATLLSGGALGASADSDFNNGMANSLAYDYDVAVPCVSQDATTDITMGVTDPDSTYQIASVIADLTSAMINRSSVQNRKEAQGVAGFRINQKAKLYAEAQTTSSYLVQLVGQDTLVVDYQGNLTWKQPHVMGAMLGGMRCGVSIGTPLTFKYLNINGLGMYVNPSTGIDGSDFNPITDATIAIQAGVTFAEPNQGSWRIVVDNTTYGIDQNFVFNRGSVVQAANYIAKTVRSQLELIYVGQKIAGNIATSMLNTISGIMNSLLTAQIISPSPGLNMPLGWSPTGTIIQINNNTATVTLPVVPVQGLDFILITFQLNGIQQSA